MQSDCRCACETQPNEREDGKLDAHLDFKTRTQRGVSIGPCSVLFLRPQPRCCINRAGTARPEGPLSERFPTLHTGFQGSE